MTRAEKERKHYRGIIQDEIRYFWLWRKELEQELREYELDLMPGCNYPKTDADMIRSSETSDPTGRKASRGYEKASREDWRKSDAVMAVLTRIKNAEPEKYRLIELFYWNGRYTAVGVAIEMSISKTTFWRWHDEIIREIAKLLKWPA